jgi:hypothetical protein
MKITIKIWGSGDWIEMWFGDECITKGHGLCLNDVQHLLWHLGHDVVIENVTEEV